MPIVDAFFQVFNPLLQHLYRIMQNASFVGSTHRKPIEILNELTSLAFSSNCKTNLPVCSIIVELVSLSFFENVILAHFIKLIMFSHNSYQNQLLEIVVANCLLHLFWVHFSQFHCLRKMTPK